MKIVTKSIKEARRMVGCGVGSTSELKTIAHRRHRRDINTRLQQLTQEVNHAHGLDEIKIDMQPKVKHVLTAWDVS